MHVSARSSGRWARWIGLGALAVSAQVQGAAGYAELLSLNDEWRAFERPALRDGAPDYTPGAMSRRADGLRALQARLAAIDATRWPVAERIDYDLVRAQMNGLEFDLRWLRPWQRDPAYYQVLWTEQSDTPEHEGPTNHAVVELWQYSFPLDPAAEARLAAGLRVIPPFLAQARGNLTGDARDLWVTGTGTMRKQADELQALGRRVEGAGAELRAAVADALAATRAFVEWLEAEAPLAKSPVPVSC